MLINTYKINGTSLIEILVALFVVSVGLLGIARLEIFATQANFESIQRTSASMIAHDFMEKMRANPTGLSSYINNTVGDGSAATPSTACSSADCTTSDIVDWDLYTLDQQLMGADELAGSTNTGGLVSPRACITGPSGGGPGEYVVSIAWKGHQPQPNPTISTCGNGAGLYGTNEEFRRIMSITFYVSDDGVS